MPSLNLYPLSKAAVAKKLNLLSSPILNESPPIKEKLLLIGLLVFVFQLVSKLYAVKGLFGCVGLEKPVLFGPSCK